MELSKKLTASKLKNKGVRPAVISKLAKAIDTVKTDGSVSQKSVKRVKSRKATRARKTASRSSRKSVSSRKKKVPNIQGNIIVALPELRKGLDIPVQV